MIDHSQYCHKIERKNKTKNKTSKHIHKHTIRRKVYPLSIRIYILNVIIHRGYKNKYRRLCSIMMKRNILGDFVSNLLWNVCLWKMDSCTSNNRPSSGYNILIGFLFGIRPYCLSLAANRTTAPQ